MSFDKYLYCDSLTNYSRIKSREVMIGTVPVGGNNPIRIQSMTTTDPMDTEGTVQQCLRLIQAGCEIIRLTAPSIKSAKNLKNIKDAIRNKGIITPLVADIHFTPNAAIEAAKIVEKIRINPGNFSDKKKFEFKKYSELEYETELKRIEEKFVPLLDVCKRFDTTMRIGTNHGSLSDRIMSQYGDTPLGMVESALEFVRICEKYDYDKIILSMKSSNPIVMVQAYRLLVCRMKKENMYYPLHLGVTEAGDGDDARIKSAMGIGTLLRDGIGDTVRVSLTEKPEAEILPAKNIVRYILLNKKSVKIEELKDCLVDPFSCQRRVTNNVLNIGGKYSPTVMIDFSAQENITRLSFIPLGYKYSLDLDKWHVRDRACDLLFLGNRDIGFPPPSTLKIIFNYSKWKTKKIGYPLFSKQQYLLEEKKSETLNIVRVFFGDLDNVLITKLKRSRNTVILFSAPRLNMVGTTRTFLSQLNSFNLDCPVIFEKCYNEKSKNEIKINSSIDFGSILLDGQVDGISISSRSLSILELNELSFNILQASRTRISKTEYISCPSCGRTLFDLEKTTAKIRDATSHLKGLKIGIMGCIVNGPGEMADADYGYVGTGPGKISLYKQRKVVKKNIPTSQALDELIELIKKNGDWVDC